MTFYIHSLTPIFAKPVLTLLSMILLRYKKQTSFSILTWSSIIDLIKHLQRSVDQTMRLFGEH